MKYNWQLPDWPHFKWAEDVLIEEETEFLRRGGLMQGSVMHVDATAKTGLVIELLTQEAYKTSEIEGELLNRASLQSSIRRHFGIQAPDHNPVPAEEGVAEMMQQAYATYDRALTKRQLCEWHRMLMKERRDLRDVGRYRTHAEPTQIVSGALGKQRLHYEAPPSSKMTQEMNAYVKWYNQSRKNHSALVRAGLAHLYFESIHPFEDGNGRIGRAISEKALSQRLGHPTLIALSLATFEQRGRYYEALQRASFDLDATTWLLFFGRLVLNAQEHTQRLINFLVAKTQFYNQYEDKLNPRQLKVVQRILKEGTDGWEGGLSAKNYISITKTSRATATRDLHDLVKIGALRSTGQLKHTRYHLNLVEYPTTPWTEGTY